MREYKWERHDWNCYSCDMHGLWIDGKGEPWFFALEASQRLGLTRQRVHQLGVNGTIRKKYLRGEVLFSAKDVNKEIEQRMAKGGVSR